MDDPDTGPIRRIPSAILPFVVCAVFLFGAGCTNLTGTNKNVSVTNQAVNSSLVVNQAVSAPTTVTSVDEKFHLQSSAACWSNFPIRFTGEEAFTVVDLQQLLTEHSLGAQIPAHFYQDVAQPMAAGWDIATFCVDANNQVQPIVYFAMVNNKADGAVMIAPAGVDLSKSAGNKIGFWQWTNTTDTNYQPIVFSDVIATHGMGDLARLSDLVLSSVPNPTNVKNTVTVTASTGGGDGPSGWSLDLRFDPSAKKLSVQRYCTSDASSGTTVHTCKAKIF